MAGIALSIVRKTTITLPVIASNGSLIMPPLSEFVDALGWVSGALMVRVFASTINGANAKVKVLVMNTMVAPDDPSTTFVADTLAEAELTTATTAGTMIVARVPTPDANEPQLTIGRYLGVYLYLEGGNSGLTTNSSVTIAVDLIGRDA